MKTELLAALGLLLGSTASLLAQAMPADPAKIAPMPAPAPVATAPSVDCDCCEQQCPRFSFSVAYLLWWIKDGPLPVPLVTVGSGTDFPPAALGQPGTSVVYGGKPIDFGRLNGYRLDAGYALNSDASWTAEASWFQLEKAASFFSIASDGNGNPTIGRPIINAVSHNENVELVSLTAPGQFVGGIAVESTSRLQGFDVNIARNRIENLSGIDILFGFRCLNLLESLTIPEQFFDPTAGGAGLTFLGQAVNNTDPQATVDRITTSNWFYGPQLGARYAWNRGDWSLDVQGKVALGWTHEVVTIDGHSVWLIPGAPVNAVGGVLAQTTNIGQHTQTESAVVPEFDLNLSYRVNSWMQVRLGYSFLFWSTLERPGTLVDRTINRTLPPTDPLFAPNGSEFHPQLLFSRSSFWAQGFNLGVAVQY